MNGRSSEELKGQFRRALGRLKSEVDRLEELMANRSERIDNLEQAFLRQRKELTTMKRVGQDINRMKLRVDQLSGREYEIKNSLRHLLKLARGLAKELER